MNSPESLFRILQKNPELGVRSDGLPDIGSRPDGMRFSNDVSKIEDAFQFYANSEKMLSANLPMPPKQKIRLGGGSPAKFPAFPPAVEKAIAAFTNPEISYYPLAAGPESMRVLIAEYLSSIGILNNQPYPESSVNNSGLTPDNIIFTTSTTQGYTLLLETIVRPNDVVLMTGPNYGLFSFNPERIGGIVELVPLSKKDNWLINPEVLARKIDDTNQKLTSEHFKRQGYSDKVESFTPRVVAFINTNPHNPTGKVMGLKHKGLLEELGNVCKDRGVFVIDDLVYRDLTFDRDNMAHPLAAIPGQFKNTISMFGLSKSYGLAGARAGAIAGDEVITRALRNKIFQRYDSTPLPQAAALTGAFNNTPERNVAYNLYFDGVVPEYQLRYSLLQTMVDGIQKITDETKVKTIKNEVDLVTQDPKETDELLKGIDKIKTVEGTEPESGFFALIDFSGLKDSWYYTSKIENVDNLMQFMYCEANIKFISGKSIGWPDESQLVGRVTYALDRAEIVEAFRMMKKAIGSLTTVPRVYTGDNPTGVQTLGGLSM